MVAEYNPYKMWKDFYDQSSSFVDEKMKEDFPSQWMGQILEMNLQVKKLLNETTKQYFEQVNIPTKQDLASISSLVINVESKVENLEDLLEETQENQVNQADFQRTITNLKRDMKGLDNKLNQIITLIESSQDSLKTDLAKIESAAKVEPAKESKPNTSTAQVKKSN